MFIVVLSFTSSFFYAFVATFSNDMPQEELDWVSFLSLSFEVTFLFDILINSFFVERHFTVPSQGNKTVERDIRRIFILYLKEEAVIDFVAILPFKDIA